MSLNTSHAYEEESFAASVDGGFFAKHNVMVNDFAAASGQGFDAEAAELTNAGSSSRISDHVNQRDFDNMNDFGANPDVLAGDSLNYTAHEAGEVAMGDEGRLKKNYDDEIERVFEKSADTMKEFWTKIIDNANQGPSEAFYNEMSTGIQNYKNYLDEQARLAAEAARQAEIERQMEMQRQAAARQAEMERQQQMMQESQSIHLNPWDQQFVLGEGVNVGSNTKQSHDSDTADNDPERGRRYGPHGKGNRRWKHDGNEAEQDASVSQKSENTIADSADSPHSQTLESPEAYTSYADSIGIGSAAQAPVNINVIATEDLEIDDLPEIDLPEINLSGSFAESVTPSAQPVAPAAAQSSTPTEASTSVAQGHEELKVSSPAVPAIG